MNIAAEIRDRNQMTAIMISDALEAFERRAAIADTLKCAVVSCGQNISEFQRKDNREFGHFEHFIEICMDLMTRDSDKIESMLHHAELAAFSEEPFPIWKQKFVDSAGAERP